MLSSQNCFGGTVTALRSLIDGLAEDFPELSCGTVSSAANGSFIMCSLRVSPEIGRAVLTRR